SRNSSHQRFSRTSARIASRACSATDRSWIDCTTCPKARAISTPTTMIPTSPANARQPCSGLGRWKCMLDLPAAARAAQVCCKVASVGLDAERIEMPAHIGVIAGEGGDPLLELAERPAKVAAALLGIRQRNKAANALEKVRGLLDVDLAVRDAVIGSCKLQLLLHREMVERLAGRRQLPIGGMHPQEATVAEIGGGSGHVAGAAAPRPVVELVDAVEQARRFRHVDLPSPAVVPELFRQRLADDPHLLVPSNVVDHLLRRERDQHADDDNAHFARERAPAVKRFGKVEMHNPMARRTGL